MCEGGLGLTNAERLHTKWYVYVNSQGQLHVYAHLSNLLVCVCECVCVYV